MRIRRFIVGVDGSVPARAAIRWALTHAHDDSVRVRLVHVADDEWGTIGTQMIDEVDKDARNLLDAELEYAKTASPGSSVEGELRAGSPMWELATFSAPDVLIIVGTHKSGFHYGRAFGSRSLQLANSATGPVAVIPELATGNRHGVVVGVDDSPAAWAAADVAADMARSLGSELVALRSTYEERSETEIEDELSRRLTLRQEQSWDLLTRFLDRIGTRQPEVVSRGRVSTRPAGVALSEMARTSELLVIGDSRRERAHLGSLGAVAYDVLLNLSSPTIVVHAPAATTETHASRESLKHEEAAESGSA